MYQIDPNNVEVGWNGFAGCDEWDEFKKVEAVGLSPYYLNKVFGRTIPPVRMLTAETYRFLFLIRDR